MKLSDFLNTHKSTKIKNVILDLDETLISATSYDESNHLHNRDKNMNLFTYHHMSGDYIIAERPHVQKFLDFLFSNFNVSVWTAASKSYALFVINNVILSRDKRKLDYILYSSHCDISKNSTGCIKNLEQLFHIYGYNKNNTLIIDDNLEVFSKQSNKVINIKPFISLKDKSEKDTELLKIEKFLSGLIKNNGGKNRSIHH